MKKMTIAVLLLAMTVWFAACTNDANAPATQAQESTETQNAVSDDTAAEPEMTENTGAENTETTEPAAATETAETTENAAGETPVDAGRVTNYTVDFSDVEGIRTMTAGHADEELLVLAVVSEKEQAEQEIEIYRVQNEQKSALFRFTIPQTLEFIGAVAGDDDEIYFTAVERTDANRAGFFTVYRVDLDDQEVHTLYEGAADELNYGHNLAADDDAVFFTENMWEQDGLYFADVVMVKDDGKQIVNVEVFPSEHVSLLVKDDRLLYAAARDDQQFVVAYDYDDNITNEYQVAGDNANFRVTDYNDGIFLLDNYNGHPEMTGSMVLVLHTGNQELDAVTVDGKNIHSAVFTEDDEPVLAVTSAGLTAGWAQMRREINGSEQTLFITEIGGETQTPAGSAMTGVWEEDDRVIRYPQPVSEEYYGNFTLIYQVYR